MGGEGHAPAALPLGKRPGFLVSWYIQFRIYFTIVYFSSMYACLSRAWCYDKCYNIFCGALCRPALPRTAAYWKVFVKLTDVQQRYARVCNIEFYTDRRVYVESMYTTKWSVAFLALIGMKLAYPLQW